MATAVHEETSRTPSWTVFFFSGGTLFLPVLAIMKVLRIQDREATADLEVFAQRQLGDCTVAVRWVSTVYLRIWVGLEVEGR
jgi:hypothetical protein